MIANIFMKKPVFFTGVLLFGLFIYGRIGENKERNAKLDAAARKDRIEVDLEDE